MKIAYVTMQFPVASEAFAAVELRALRCLGCAVDVLAYRGAVPGAGTMLTERGLADIAVDHGGLGAGFAGLGAMLRQPRDSLWLLGMILRFCWRRPGQMAKALALLPRSLALLERLEALKPDVVHLFWGHYPSLLGLLARRRLPQSVISLFLGAYDLEQGFPLSALLARQADLVLTHAKANLPALAALGLPDGAVRVAYRGIEVPAQPPAPPKTPGLMVVAERLVPQKCTGDAIRVFAAVHRALPQTRLVVCGQGPEAPRLKRLVEELGLAAAVRFAGHLPHAELLDLLSRSEVTLSLSRSPSERLPNVTKEAMLRRCLCLASRTPGIEELIDNGVSGLIVDPDDIDIAALRLRSVLNDPAAVASYGRRAQAKIIADFDAGRLMAERVELWSAARRERRRDAAA